MIQITNRRRFVVAALLPLAVLAVIFWFFFWGGASLRKSGDVIIAPGTSAAKVWQFFVSEGYTRRTLPWRYYAWIKRAGSRIKAGAYRVEKGESVPQVIERLASGDTLSNELSLTFPEGFTLAQMADRVAAKGLGSAAEFRSGARAANFAGSFSFLSGLPENRSLEGYLFPDTYRIAPDDQAADVIKRLLGEFDGKITPDLRLEIQRSGRTLDQIIIMASIIEREVIKNEDMALVSGVLWKRADAKAGLDADATIRYALNKWDQPLTFQDLNVDSPYNTRKYRGLPPGPICNPGLRAVLAAIRPQASDYYYYLSAPDGRTIFSKTNDEHNGNKAKYLK